MARASASSTSVHWSQRHRQAVSSEATRLTMPGGAGATRRNVLADHDAEAPGRIAHGIAHGQAPVPAVCRRTVPASGPDRRGQAVRRSAETSSASAPRSSSLLREENPMPLV